jgi:hypothetical protein
MAAFLYLMVIVCIFAQLFVRQPLVVTNDAATTANKILRRAAFPLGLRCRPHRWPVSHAAESAQGRVGDSRRLTKCGLRRVKQWITGITHLPTIATLLS